MLGNSQITPTIPATDIERAKKWYEEKLGLTPKEEGPEGSRYVCGDGSTFLLYNSQFAGTAQHTVASWSLDDFDSVAEALRSKGVTFEDYDLPGLKTENGIADFEGVRAAWFKDSEGNILAIGDKPNRR